MFAGSYFGLYLLFLGMCLGDYPDWDSKWQILCPALYPRVFTSYTPRGNLTGGFFTLQHDVIGIKQCVASCCTSPQCNVILMHNSSCYHVQCSDSKMCIPLYRPELASANPPSMVLVKPVEEEEWSDVLELSNNDQNSLLKTDIDQSTTFFGATDLSCLKTTDCDENEICLTRNAKSEMGECQCMLGYKRNKAGICQAKGQDSDSVIIDKMRYANIPTSAKPQTKILVTALSKEVRLPENEVSLSAVTIPEESETDHYNYAWTLLSQPEGHNGIMTDQNRKTVKLSDLSEGLYQFKVTVNGPHSNGEAFANVSVLPPNRINKAPIAIISPPSQIVKLPNTGAVLDGSSSKDDDKIISYHWELQQGPLGYQPSLVDTPTLQLDKLIDGNYTFKLTVEDSDHVSNFTTTNVTVLKVTDYPPSANAGQDVIIYLPQNTLTLNGNLSTDDRGIASWEWTKSQTNQNKAVDMQDTRTPYLHLSNLEEGMYTFTLKVTDDSEQFSTAEVHVFVKPPTNKPPNAEAGRNITIALPDTQVVLNGSMSKDDFKIVSYLWEQMSGPNKAVLVASNESVTNATKLTKGDYVFKLTVIDDNGNKDSDVVYVSVTQTKNAAPIANAGGNRAIEAPVTALVFNGSLSSDDFRIGQWLWTREPNSLAVGNVIEGTDKSPILLVTDILPGRYIFTLKVIDDQGLSSTDTASWLVKPDPQLMRLVELTLNVQANRFPEVQKNALIVKLQMLLRDESTIVVRNLKEEVHTGRVVLVFYVEKSDGTPIKGPEVVKKLKEKLRQDSGILELSVTNIETTICQNNCSNRGVCNQETRKCTCQTFWMENLITKFFGDNESNCDWSVLYVIIGFLSLIMCWIGLIWGLICLCQKMFAGKPRPARPKKKLARYSLLQSEPKDDNSPLTAHKMVLSDTDTDSDDVMFDKFKGKTNGHVRNGRPRNGFLRSASRVKT